jgi:soluble lytic murein transglycosylase
VRQTGRAAARQLLARPHRFTYLPVDPGKWYELKRIVAQEAAADRQFALAYDIARQVDDALAPGADLAAQPLQVRDEYTNLTWLAGSLAIRALNRPAEAVALFDKYSEGGRSLQVLTKGAYWAGRAAAQAGQLQVATGSFQQGRGLSRPLLRPACARTARQGDPAPLGSPQMLVTPEQRSAFAIGRWCARPAVSGPRTGAMSRRCSFGPAREHGRQFGAPACHRVVRAVARQDLAVWTARLFAQRRRSLLLRAAYPVLAGTGITRNICGAIPHGITAGKLLRPVPRSAVRGRAG